MDMVAKQATRSVGGRPSVRPKARSDNEVLKPSGSVIQWATLYRKLAKSGGKRGGPRLRWFVRVRCGACRKERDVIVRSGISPQEVLNAQHLALTPVGECAGLCRDCWMKVWRHDLKLPDGSEIFFSEWDAAGLPAVCGECSERQKLVCETSAAFDARAAYGSDAWSCCACGHVLGMQRRENGATLFWLDRSSSRRRTTEKVAYLCAGCGEKHYLKAPYAFLPEWRGRCPSCRARDGSPKKYTDDRVAPSGTLTRFSKERNGAVEVVYKLCQHVVERPRVYAISEWDAYPEICPACRRDPAAFAARVRELASANGDRQSPGRKPRITEAKVRAAFRKLGQFAPQEKIAEEIGVDARGLRDWHTGQGLSYRQCRQRFGGTGSN